MNHFVAIGFGYAARAVAGQLNRKHWRVTGTSRTQAGALEIGRLGYESLTWNALTPDEEIFAAICDATHLLVSTPPLKAGDPVIRRLAKLVDDMDDLFWIGYLSTIGVYGQQFGEWIDENTPTSPIAERSRLRLHAEDEWKAFEKRHERAVHIFRLSGIYGPGRNTFDRLRDGKAQRIIKPGQVFNRIHVEDIGGAVKRAMGANYYFRQTINLTDDEPAPPQDVIGYAAKLMGIEPPPEVAFAEAELSEMARSFYCENKRVSNRVMKEELRYRPRYPTYREGLRAIWKELAG